MSKKVACWSAGATMPMESGLKMEYARLLSMTVKIASSGSILQIFLWVSPAASGIFPAMSRTTVSNNSTT